MQYSYIYITGLLNSQMSSVTVYGRHRTRQAALSARPKGSRGSGYYVALPLMTGPFGGRDPQVGERLGIYEEGNHRYAVRPH